jgi:sigma-54 dependent transcriptional regulator, acetoin dehydrogenase operon transcriptional activator AcoR
MNDHARSVLGPGDQEALIDRALEVLGTRQSGAVTVELPSGPAARMSCRRVGESDGVVQVRLLAAAASDVAGPVASAAVKAPMYLPGLVGNGVLWLRACRAAEEACQAAEWVALEGEAGVGKLAMARAVHQRHNPAASFHVLDAASPGHGQDLAARARGELLESTGVLVIQHVDTLSGRQLRGLASALQEAWSRDRQAVLRVVVTLHRDSRDSAKADLTELLRFFPRTVEVPPLRHHIEDLHELVPFLLARLSQQGRVTCSTDAMQLLMRHSWPGNIEQLWQVLRQVVQSRRSGTIKPKDLPPECWTVSRRLLNPLESLERDAIVASLLDHDGNKVKAAEALGMSRATIYRKIHEYGIVTS